MVLGVLAFWPLFSSGKYVRAQAGLCSQDTTLTIIYANLRDSPKAFNMVKKMARSESADLIAMSELPPHGTLSDYKSYLSDYPFVVFYDQAEDGRILGSALLIASKLPLENPSLFVEDYPRKPRAIIKLDVESENEFRFILTHPKIPLALAGARRRDGLLSKLPKILDDGEPFIIAGDFNMTPWTPAFRKLPGRRAGDPRMSYSWKAGIPPIGIPIDHFLIDERFGLQSFRVLSDTGSDHYPILTRVCPN